MWIFRFAILSREKKIKLGDNPKRSARAATIASEERIGRFPRLHSLVGNRDREKLRAPAAAAAATGSNSVDLRFCCSDIVSKPFHHPSSYIHHLTPLLNVITSLSKMSAASWRAHFTYVSSQTQPDNCQTACTINDGLDDRNCRLECLTDPSIIFVCSILFDSIHSAH